MHYTNCLTMPAEIDCTVWLGLGLLQSGVVKIVIELLILRSLFELFFKNGMPSEIICMFDLTLTIKDSFRSLV